MIVFFQSFSLFVKRKMFFFFQRGFVLFSVNAVLVIVIKEFFFYHVCFFFFGRVDILFQNNFFKVIIFQTGLRFTWGLSFFNFSTRIVFVFKGIFPIGLFYFMLIVFFFNESVCFFFPKGLFLFLSIFC